MNVTSIAANAIRYTSDGGGGFQDDPMSAPSRCDECACPVGGCLDVVQVATEREIARWHFACWLGSVTDKQAEIAACVEDLRALGVGAAIKSAPIHVGTIMADAGMVEVGNTDAAHAAQEDRR